MRALKYFFAEAGESLWRGRRAALLAILTIAAGLFVLGFFLAINANLQRVVARWSESAELSVFLADDVTQDQLKTVDELIGQSGLASQREYVSKEQAAARFKQDFPDMASATSTLESNPFPASFEVRLKPEMREATGAVSSLATTLGGLQGVADVRFDRGWLDRLNTLVRFARGVGLLVVVLLAFAAALTVANVVRLAAVARHDEIEIMQLVGAPIAYVRGPFIVEGLLQGGAGAALALALLWALFTAIRYRYGQFAAEAVGLSSITFLPVQLWFAVLAGGMLLGCIGGIVVARSVR
ncbi:MAG TPA: permease-like cell division protein FtsX [Vicinamibacterales bacterium]